MKEKTEDAKPTIRDLFPALTAEEAASAEENFNGYIDLALEIYENICRDPDRYAKFRTLTERRAISTIKSKRLGQNTNSLSSQ